MLRVKGQQLTGVLAAQHPQASSRLRCVCTPERRWENCGDGKRECRQNDGKERKREKKRESCLAFLTQQPYREDMVPSPYFLNGGTDFKPDFNITGLNLLHRGLTYSHLCIHTEFLASKNWLNFPPRSTDQRQTESVSDAEHTGGHPKKREKPLCSDSLPQAMPLLSSTGPDDTSRSHPVLPI